MPLDVLITRADQQITSVKVDPPLLSDHSLVVASAELQEVPEYTVCRLARRSWRSLDVVLFIRDLQQSTLLQAPPFDA